MANIELGFDPQVVRRLVDQEPWETDERGTARRAVGLGSVFTLTPSGKVYAPFACDNLRPCPVCKGTGKVRCPVKQRIVKKWTNRNQRTRTLWLQRYGSYPNWPKHIKAASAKLNKLLERADTACRRCGTFGSHEAWDDECWDEYAREELNNVGLCLETSEGDGAYLLAVEYQDETVRTDA